MDKHNANFYDAFSGDQLRAGYARNAAYLKKMADKATATGKKVNGYTADDLHGKAAAFAALSVASDTDIRAHISTAIASMRRPHAS